MGQLIQLFNARIPRNLLISFLTHVSNDIVRDDKYFVVNVNSYRKSIDDGSLVKFCDDIRDMYIPSKKRYADAVDTYSRFLTVIRQVCRVNGMEIKKSRVGSGHNNTYFIYHVYPGVDTG